MKKINFLKIGFFLTSLVFCISIIFSALPASADTCYCICTEVFTPKGGGNSKVGTESCFSAADNNECRTTCQGFDYTDDSGKYSHSYTLQCGELQKNQCSGLQEQKGQAGKTVKLTNPISTSDIPTLAGNIIQALLGIVGAVALLMVVYGGFLWLTSAGNPERIKKGKETLIWAVIGLAFIFSSYMLARFVFQALLG